MLVITGVGGLIVIYSVGYMHDDDEERRFFATWTCSSSRCCCSSWPGTCCSCSSAGASSVSASYLLIGFWYERPAAVAAAKKAFVMNAIGDAHDSALALFLLITKTGTLDYAASFAGGAGPLADRRSILVALCLLGGAVAKSAQLPLHTWLPDAMEGPTPVSALIHAATMVTAGVYLIARMHPIFELAPSVQDTVAGDRRRDARSSPASIALVQTDIKRVIAYSTMSQIGYMFLGVGVGAYAGGMFHLLTHAFFKALLFLARRQRHPRARRRAGHPPDGRPAAADAGDLRRLPDRRAGARRHPAVRRLLLQGPDHRRRRSRAAAGSATCSSRSRSSARS